MKKEPVSVTIYKEEYLLRTSAPEEQVRRVANRVDSQMCRLANEKNIFNSTKLAVWTALDLAAELEELRARHKELQERYDKLLQAVQED